MEQTTNMSKAEILISKVAKMIAAQSAGEVTGFTTENLNTAYLSLAKGDVSEDTAVLLAKMLGDDWAEKYEPSDDAEDMEEEAKDMALKELIEHIDENNQQESISTLATVVMMISRELGWIETSRAAHDRWFYAT